MFLQRVQTWGRSEKVGRVSRYCYLGGPALAAGVKVGEDVTEDLRVEVVHRDVGGAVPVLSPG